MARVRLGAEGDLTASTWNGRRCIVKERKAKGYRNPQLDASIRRSRTVREAEMIRRVKAMGVRAPLVYFADVASCRLFLQYLPGRTVRRLPPRQLVAACRKIGRLAATLHRNAVMHGDLTTSNFIIWRNHLYAIDFGLSQATAKPGDHAVDLRLFKEMLSSSHTNVMEEAWKSFLAGYGETAGRDRLERALGLVAVIEGRGRYARVV